MGQFRNTLLTILVLFALVATPLVSSSSLSYGVQGGIALSNMMAIDPDGGGSRSLASIVGTVAGGYVEYPLWAQENDWMNLNVRTGLQYSLLGGDMGGVLEFHYIQIPLLMKLGFPLQMPGESYLLAGLGGGYLITVTSPETVGVDMDLFNRVELQALFGMGFGTPWGLSFDIRYQTGMNTRTSEGGSLPFLLYDSTVSLVASYKIH